VLAVLAIAAAAALAGSVVAADDAAPLEARAYEVLHRPLADAADLVSAALSEDGTVTLRPRLHTLVVQDRAAVLDRVAALLDDFDVPPRNVEITVSLFLGKDRRQADGPRREAGDAFSREVRGMLETLGDFTRWVDYEPIGSRSVTGTEGVEIVANVSDEYRVVLRVGSVDDRHGVVSFDEFVLQRLLPDEAGVRRSSDLYAGGGAMATGRLHVIGAAKDPSSRQALFLFLQVQAR
jgi:hypothetical protein